MPKYKVVSGQQLGHVDASGVSRVLTSGDMLELSESAAAELKGKVEPCSQTATVKPKSVGAETNG